MTFVLITTYAGSALADSDGLTLVEEVYDAQDSLAGESSFPEEESPGAEDIPIDTSTELDPPTAEVEPDYTEEPIIEIETDSYDEAYDTEEYIESAIEESDELPDDIVFTENPINEEDSNNSEELIFQTFEAALGEAELYNGKRQPKKQLAELQHIWKWLFNSDKVPVQGPDQSEVITDEADSYDIGYEYFGENEYESEYLETYGYEYEDRPVAIEVSGFFPAGISAEGTWIQFENETVESETPLFAVALKFYDGYGEEYIPDEKTKEKIQVSLRGMILNDASSDNADFVVYAFKEDTKREKKENKKYAANVTVYRDLTRDRSGLSSPKYSANQSGDAVVFTNDKDGFTLTGQNSVDFETKDTSFSLVVSALYTQDVVERYRAEAAAAAAEEAAEEAEAEAPEEFIEEAEEEQEPAESSEEIVEEPAESLEEVAEQAETAEEPAESLEEVAEESAQSVEQAVEEPAESAEEAAEEQVQSVEEAAEEQTQSVEEAAEEQTQSVEDTAGEGQIGETVESAAESTAEPSSDAESTSENTEDLYWHSVEANIENGETSLSIEGLIPENAQASISYADTDTAAEEKTDQNQTTLLTVDVTLEDQNQVQIKPEEAVNVSITDTAIADALTEGSELTLWDVSEKEAPVQVENATFEGDTASFETDTLAVYAITKTILEKELTASDGRTYKITVSYDSASGIPADAELAVSEIKEGDEGYDEYVAQSADKLGTDSENLNYARAFDISLIDPKTGETCQPNKDVQVSIELLDAEIHLYENVDVLHFHGEDEDQIDLLNSSVSGETVEFETAGFSVYVVCGYTVDFHWGEYTYSIKGENEILLSELFEKLGVTEITISDVKDVSFSDPALVEVSKIEASEEQTGDWLLRSLAPFSSEEALTLALNNGKSVEIKVTDADDTDYNVYNNSNAVIGSWTLDSEGVLTVTGSGAMKDYTDPPWVGGTPWFEYIVKDSNHPDPPVTKVVITDGITRIGTNSFTRTYNLNEIDASNCSTLQTIGASAFKQQSGSTTHNYQNPKIINFSGCKNLTTIEGQAFQDCKGIEELDISGTKLSASYITTESAGFGSGKNTLKILKANGCTTDFTTLDLTGWNSLQTVELSGCTNLTSLTLPSSVTTLDISGCTDLDSLDLSSCTSLTTVKVGNRGDLADLSWLTLPASVTTLDASGFTSLASIEDVPESVTNLILSDCTSLTVLDLSSHTSLADIDLSNNDSLTALKLPTSVSSLNVEECPNLIIYFDGTSDDIPEGLIPDTASVICWGDYIYPIARDAEVKLEDIFTALNITAINSDEVDSISAFDESCLQVSGLNVKYLKSFADSQTLTITLKNGFSGELSVVCAPLEESDILNEFLDDSTGFAYEGDTATHSLSEMAILNEGDKLNLTLSFSEIPEGQEGERQMKLLEPMKYTFPAGLTVDQETLPETVTISAESGGTTYSFPASVVLNSGTGELTIAGDYGDQEELVGTLDNVSFTVPVTVQASSIPETYALDDIGSLQLKVDKPHNVKISSLTSEYDEGSGAIRYTVTVEAESDLDYNGAKYPVTINDLSVGTSPVLEFESGSFTYAHKDGFVLPEGSPESQVNDTNVTVEAVTFTGFPLTAAHMYEGDTITLTYTAKILKREYNAESQETQIQNIVTITNSDNPSNKTEDDNASVTDTVSYTPLTREYVTLDGSWAYWKVTVNPDGYTLGGGENLTLSDTFDDGKELEARQSIDYSSITVTNAAGVTYDYYDKTGTFVIPDNTAVEITYRTRITAQAGEAVLFHGTAVLKDAGGNTIASATAGADDEVVIYPSPSDVDGDNKFMLKLLVYGEGAMESGIEGAQFILLDANQRPMEYKAGDKKGNPVTFVTGSNGYVNIELNTESDGLSIEKNTGYYLEMSEAVAGYQKDNTLYSFMITDDPSYDSGGFYKYYNGDTMKVRLYLANPGLSVSMRFSGNYDLTEVQKNNVTAILQKLDGENNWVEVERHPYTDSEGGSIRFNEPLYDGELEYQNIYRVVQENEIPWDLPDEIHLESTYSCTVNTDPSKSGPEPEEFWVKNANDSVSVVIDNRYDEPQLDIVKMDKLEGEVLPGAVFSVYRIVNGEKSGDEVKAYTTDDNGELVIRGGNPYESEILYGIYETKAPEGYLLPQEAKTEWHYFYFCNDEYLEPSILANLPEGATAVNLTKSADRITIDNQKEVITVPVMKIWQGGSWPENTEVIVGLYQSVDGGEAEPVCYDDGTQRTVELSEEKPFDNTAFKDLPSRDEEGRDITYSIKEESIGGQDPLAAGYNQEYGISSAGVYIVRNKPATALTVSKEWYHFSGEKVTDETLLGKQSSVTFDVYRSSEPYTGPTLDDGITNADMTNFVSNLVKVREDVNFGSSDNWQKSIPDLDKQDDLGNLYYYYVLETVPSFGNELYVVDEATGTITIQNKIAPPIVNLTVTKAGLVDDPRPESRDREFEFSLKLQKDDAHPIRCWKVYSDGQNPENDLVTDWNGEVRFVLKPEQSITLDLPDGVTASVTEDANPEYTVDTTATVEGDKSDNNRTFSYNTSEPGSEPGGVKLEYTNTLRVICKVVADNEDQTPFETLKRALEYIRNNPDKFTSPWTIYMLEDYTIPVTDIVDVQAEENLTLTTASTDDPLFPFNGGEETDRAVITRGGAGESMFTSAGTLTLENICLDGGSAADLTATGNGGLVKSTGTLNLNDKTTLRNSAADGKGGAVYAEGTVNIVDEVVISGNSAPSASAMYLSGTLNMTGGSITGNTGASDGAVVVESTDDRIHLSGSPEIFNNTHTPDGTAANLYIGVDSDNVVNVDAPGLAAGAQIGISAMEGHMLIGEQFATADFEQTANLNRFVNDVYGYRGKLKDGTSTNIVWDGLKIKIQKIVDPVGANPNDKFTITLSSPAIVMSSYIIDGTLDYTVTAARQGRPGTIELRNVMAGEGKEIAISPLPVGSYKITEAASNYTPTYELEEAGSPAEPIADGNFTAENDCTVKVTNTRRLSTVQLTKTLDDRLKGDSEPQEFNFTVKLTEADGTAISDFTLAEGITTSSSGEANFTMLPTNAAEEVRNFTAPVGATMMITEEVNPNYEITTSAHTMPNEGEGESITDEDTDNDNIVTFPVTDDGAEVTFANVRKMADIELRKNLVNKVSLEELFTFNVTLTRADGSPAASYIMYRDKDDPSKNIVTDDNGQADITFVFGQNESSKAVTLTIPDGTKMEVEETIVNEHPDFYDTTYSINEGAAASGRTATINSVTDSDHSIAFTNTRKTRTIIVTNKVEGYSGNVVPFTYTAVLSDGTEEQIDYNVYGFENGSMTFDLSDGQSQTLTVPYGAELTVTEGFIVGYDTTIKRGSAAEVTALSDTFVVETDLPSSSPLLFTNKQLIGLRLVNNTSSELVDVIITVEKNKIYRVNPDQTGQELIGSNKTATLSVAPGETAILEIEHDTTNPGAEQSYSVKGRTPADGYYYTIVNEPSFHEYADPALLRVYDASYYEVKGKLRYSVSDSIVTFTEQPLVTFDSNGGAWTTEMEGYHDRDGDRKVYQKAVDSGETVSCPTPDPVYPTAEETAFLGWTADEDFAKEAHSAGDDVSDKLYDFNSPVTAPVMLYAIWARDPDVRTVTVKNGLNTELTVTVKLSSTVPAEANYTLYEDADDPSNNIVTDENGEVIFTIEAKGAKNLHVPEGAKLEISANNGTAYSKDYTDGDSIPGSFTIDPVDRDGTVSFIGGRFKITDASGNLLYDADGNPAVYMDLRKNNAGDPDEAFDAYENALYADSSAQTPAVPAFVKQLVEEYTLARTAATAFPNKEMTLTTAGKDDNDFPYVGVRDRGTIYRSAVGANVNCFTMTSGNITLTNIVLDGGSELGVKIAKSVNGGLVNISGGTLFINSGTTMRNCEFAAYDNGNSSRGGAIYITNGTLNVNAGLFSNLHARRGGAICAESSANLNVIGSNGDTVFENCSTNAANDANNAGDGGAIFYNNTNASSNLVINGGSDKLNPGIIFVGCIAGSKWGDGGAIYANTNKNNDVTITGCSFTECSARNTTGKNDDGFGGGGIGVQDIKHLTVSQCSFISCDSLKGGGGILARVKNNAEDGSTVSVSNCSFLNCSCKAQGGGLAAYTDNNGATNSKTKLSVIECTFANCSSGTDNGSGGAIQCYLPCMEFSRSSFSDCWAGKEGGAINNYFGSSYTAVWNNSSMTVDNCRFIRCRAEDRYDPTALQHYGGAINSKAKTATVTDSYFEECVSTLKEGGALHIGGQGGGSKATIKGSTFKNCAAKNGGGALLSSHETLEIDGCYFYGCSSSASNGGAVYHYRNSRGDSTQKSTTIKNSIFGDPDDVENTGCSATVNGGAIWTRATTDVTLENLTISGCTAGNQGGGVYLNSTVTAAKITDGSISGSKAVEGSAVYVGNQATFSGGLTINDNVVSNINSGAIHGGKLYFEDNVKVEDNTCSSDSAYDHDVLMQIDNTTTIYTTSSGLGVDAKIGVYVPDKYFNKRGVEDKAFGTYDHTTSAGSNYLESFFNDRDSELYGYQKAAGDYNIYWGSFICKITDADGNTLVRPNGKDAVYPRLTQALDEFKQVTGGKAVYIKMLVEKYTIRQAEEISNFPAADITLTTETYKDDQPVEGKYDGKYPYRGTEGTVCTISRTTGTTQLFKLNTEGAVFRLENITLDGRNDKSTQTGNRRLIEAAAGTLVVNGGTTLQYGAASNGGAIDAAAAAQVTINGVYDADNDEPTVRFINCTGIKNSSNNNKPNGGAIRAVNLNIYNRTEETGKYGTAFINCSAYNGGAITSTGSSMQINGVFFDSCTTQSGGGAVYHNNPAENTSTTVKNCAFENCRTNGSTWAHGGAIEARTATLRVEDSSFKDCHATSDGGAVYHGYVDGNNIPSGNRDTTSIKNTTFEGCSTSGKENAYSFGGSVYTQAKTVEVIDSVIQNSTSDNYGGAIYCQTNVAESTTTISGTSVENCSVTRNGGYGGAIYSRGRELTLKKSSSNDTSISACTAPGYSGAIHMETSGSSLNVTDDTVISGCYADKGGAVYLPAGVIMNLTGSPEFTQNGYTTINNNVVNASEGACIYLAQGSRINLKDSPKFSRNILPNESRVTNGGITDFERQDIYLAGYYSETPYDTNAASIYVAGELTGDTIWVWPEQQPHRLPNEQFAKIDNGVSVSADSLSHLRNALGDETTNCKNGEYLAGVQISDENNNVYWDKMYVVSFKKIDNKAVAVPGAGFTLYEYQDTVPMADIFTPEHIVASAFSADGENDYDAQGRLLPRGMVEFTSICIGAYFMKETTVPVSFKENDTIYLVLVGTPYLSEFEENRYLWDGDGPLNVPDAATLITRYTVDAGKYFGIYPLSKGLGNVYKADVSKNLAGNNVGIQNIRNDYQASFMKAEDNGDALPGAAFTIYTAITDGSGQPQTFEDGYPKLMLWSRDGETYPAPVVSADGTASYKDVNNKTLPKGMVYFRELPLGTYYLLETAYPERNGSGHRAFYTESDRVFRLVLEEIEGSPEEINVTLSEWKQPSAGTEPVYEPLPRDEDGYYTVSNHEAVCKLTDANDNLLYVKVHDVWDKKDSQETARYIPAIYTTLEEGFSAAQTESFVYENGAPANVSTLKLKALKDFVLENHVTCSGSARAITFTTAETKAEKDRYVFSTNRTSDTSRAVIKRAYSEDASTDENSDALIMLSSGANLTLQNIKLDGQKVNYNGRAIHVTDGAALTIQDHTQIQNFKQEGSAESADSDAKGAAILLDSGTTLTVDGTSRRSAVFSDNTVTGSVSDGGAIAVGTYCMVTIANAQFLNNSAGGNGGAISVQGELPLTDVIFRKNSASENGGAIYAGEDAEIMISGGSIQTNTADLGGAVYAENQAKVIFNNASITGNTADGEDGGAINVGGPDAKLYFGGSPTVFDNFGASDPTQQKNLVLSEDTNEVIYTTEGGLKNGLIGVYVTETVSDNSTVFEEHGLPGKPFGTFSDTDRLNPHVFRNDRSLALYGIKNEDDPEIYWVDVICKLTDDNNNILYQDIKLTINGRVETRKCQAIYARITEPDDNEPVTNGFNVLRDGFDAAQGTLYTWDGSSYSAFPNNQTVKLKMLKDYDLDKGIVHTGSKRSVIFTTAEPDLELTPAMKENGDFFSYKTERTDAEGNFETEALIKRGSVSASSSMITASGKNLGIADITLDGENQNVTANGGIVFVRSNGSLTVADGAVLQNSLTSGNGGAVYVANNAAFEMTSGEVMTCSAVNGGAIYVPNGAAFEMTGGEITTCSAVNGGAVYVADGAAMELKDAGAAGATINGNTAIAAGAGIYLEQGSTLKLSGNPDFGGAGTDNDGTIQTTRNSEGKTEAAGNFVSMSSTVLKTEDQAETDVPKNGGKNYPDDSNTSGNLLVRQDIYLQGYAAQQNQGLASIELTADLTSPNGSIWVWANDKDASNENLNHYQMMHQFAVISESFTETVSENTYKAFRNARPDAFTECGGDYLTGQTGENAKYVYWTGGFDVYFMKIDGFGTELSEATFTLYSDSGCNTAYQRNGADVRATSADGTDTYKNSNGQTLPKGTVLFEKIPTGVYYMKETGVPDDYVNSLSEDANHEPIPNRYLVLVGEAELAKWETYGLTEEDVTKQTEKYTQRYKDYNVKGDYAVFLIGQDTSGNDVAVTTPDLATYGIMNISKKTHYTVLKKVIDSAYTPLGGNDFTAEFQIFRYDRTIVSGRDLSDPSGNTVTTTFKSLINGLFFAEELPLGTYYVHETNVPSRYKSLAETQDNWFVLTVTKNDIGYKPASATTVTDLELSNILNAEDAEPAAPQIPGS